jgi:hypothetical protein
MFTRNAKRGTPMASPDQHTYTATPPPSVDPAPGAPPSRQHLTTIVNVGGMIVLSTGVISLFGDWLAGWHLTRPWLQMSASFAGALLLSAVALIPKLSRSRRILFGVGGLLLIFTVIDSLDGRQVK